MRERSIVWDIAVILLLFSLVVINGLTLIQNNRIEDRLISLAAVQQNAGNHVAVEPAPAPAPAVAVTPVIAGVSPANADLKPVTGTLYDGHDNPHWVRGDEHADDGDWLVLNEGQEPNSLNPLVENDATAGDLFGRANDALVSRAWDDPLYWEPHLARAWEKAMLCRGVAAQHDAPALAAKLNAALDPAAREKLKIAKISAESDAVLRIDLSDASGDYREPVQALLGPAALNGQTWIYVDFEAGATFTGGGEVNAASVATRLQEAAAKAGFKGRFAPAWERDTSVVLIAFTDGAAATQAVKDYIESPLNMGEVTDPKSATGKSAKKVLTFDVTEEYVFEEKPVFTFHLRKDVQWHDGVPFTGRDVIFTFETMMNPKVEAAPQRNYMQDCESLKLVDGDPYTIQFIWKKPYFLAFNNSAEITIMPEHIFKFKDAEEFNKGPNNQKLIGTGAYKLESWDRAQHQLIYARNEDYYGKKPHFKKLVCKFVADTTVALQLLQAGELDEQGLTKAQAKLKLADEDFKKKFNIEVSVANVYRYIGWNARRPLFASAKVRRALTMLVDRDRIIKDIERGMAVPFDAPAHPESPTYPPHAERLHVPYDPAGAIKLLNAEGWTPGGDGVLHKDGQPFKFTLLIVSEQPEYESIANLIKDSFAQAGIVVNISNLEWSVLLQNIERLNFDAVIMGWQLGLDDDPYQLWHSSQTGEKASNFCDFVNPEVDHLIEAGRRELDEKKRTPMFQRVYEIIAEEQPYTLLFVSMRATAYDKRIQNVKFKLNGSEYERWWVPTALQKYK